MERKRSCCCGGLPTMWWWLLTLLGLPLLFLLMLSSRQGVIENDLASRSEAGLKAAGMGWVTAKLAGRDVQLQGVAASETERDEAARLVQGIDGVRDVQNLIEVKAPATLADSAGLAADADPQLEAPLDTGTGTQEALAAAQEVPAAPDPASPEAQGGGAALEQPVALTLPDQSAIPGQATAPEQAIAPDQVTEPGPTGMDDATQGQQLAVAPEPSAVPAAEPAPEPVVASASEPSAEEQAVQDCQQQLNDAMSGKTILFETNKAAIKRGSIALLDSLAGIMSSCKGVVADRGVEVSGHTDNVGNDTYNQKLSQRRADAVKDYLVGKGIDGALLKSVGYGESKPVASNDTPEGRSQNRRINFEISPE
ncbi:OmpA family protein [Thiothrix nivea]|uniref:OmpA/MotB domain protein n=1 Tax=Thiothrix nivea (strain ATCC 35100 / DSM 5205 / JP2) TaxID=870187 RepID=A0A656HLX5_THINJ|nr:OmpA family protein [Thiothrix nivea]EIJ36330.1 OmpA/MotB domain protein [Thiothrix nivea DSM 5205]